MSLRSNSYFIPQQASLAFTISQKVLLVLHICNCSFYSCVLPIKFFVSLFLSKDTAKTLVLILVGKEIDTSVSFEERSTFKGNLKGENGCLGAF